MTKAIIYCKIKNKVNTVKIMNVLDKIESPSDIKKLNNSDMVLLAEDIRAEINDITMRNGGHLSSNLGIVEATLALYRTFDFPKDKLIFDVGHQCYTHKILSGRKKEFGTLRTSGGISGFPDKGESEFDSFTTGHAGTSISEGLGMCAARDKLKEDYCVITVVGDGSIVNGLNLEAITATESKPTNFIVVLNDNGMSISKNINGFYKFISKKTIKGGYVKGKNKFKKILGDSFLSHFFGWIKNFVKRIFGGVNFFEQYGFKYVGIDDGNNLKTLCSTLEKVKAVAKDKAIFLHINTVKGKGNKDAEIHSDAYHGVGKKDCAKSVNFSRYLAETLSEQIEKDGSIVAVTAGMKDGTGLKAVEEKHKDNFYDVGIAEEYAVTLASGMAAGGLRPVVCIYSTFLQRAYDQVMHDVCLQNLPVVFCIDRAGLVGEDGKTHQGVFDLSYLTHLPNLTVLSINYPEEFGSAFAYALSCNSPVALRYPKSSPLLGETCTGDYDEGRAVLVYGEGRSGLAILAVGGRMIELAKEVRIALKNKADVYAVRKIKPLDVQTLDRLKGKKIITLEENSLLGGFGSTVSAYFSCDKRTEVHSFGVPDEFIGHGSVEEQFEKCGLTVESILANI